MRFLLLLLTLFSSLAFANNSGTQNLSTGGFPSTLAPTSGDLSVSLLASIFGVVDGVLHGTGSQILGTMFGMYNAAILTMGMVILVYVFVVGTLNTAHEGETLGKEWSSIWLPLRVVSGVALLLPKATGYSFIQIIIMWVVVQGVGVADLVWNRTLDYLGRGGVVVQPQTMFTTQGLNNQNAFLIPIAGTIFKSEVCMYSLQNILANNRLDRSQSTNFLASTLNVERDGNNANRRIIYFPGRVDNGDGTNYKGMCGSVSWDVSKDNIQTVVPTNTLATDSRSIAVRQIILNLQPQAQQIANRLIPLKNQSALGSSALPLNRLLQPNSLFYSTVDYIGIMTPFLQQQAQVNSANAYKFIDQSKKVGWIMAGAYYFDIARLNAGRAREREGTITPTFPDLSCSSDMNGCQTSGMRSAFSPVAAQLSPGPAKCPPNASNEINNFICTEYANNLFVGGNSQVNPNLPAAANIFKARSNEEDNLILRVLFSGIYAMIDDANNIMGSMGDIYHSQTIGGNPIISVSQLGVSLINTVERIWVIGTAVIMVGATLGSIIAFGFSPGVGNAIIAALIWLTPLFMAVLLPLLITGATLAYYIPLIPYILFTFGALTWFALVVEAMIAAPLVALGLAHPDGHKHLGQAQYAVMLLAGVFLRPVLMLFGFIGATILSSIMIWLVNYGFGKVWDPAYIQSDWMGIIYFVATIVVYMTIVLTVINRCFALIYEIPNKVLRWVGGTVEQGGEGAALEEFKAGVTRGLETGTNMVGEAGKTAIEGAGGLGKRAVGYAGGKGEGKDKPDIEVA